MPCPRSLEAHVRLEHPFHVRRGDSRAAVFHANLHGVTGVPDEQLDIRAAIATGILEQVRKASPDGLRLYFAPYDVDTDVQNVRLAKRNALGQKFDAPVDVR